MSDFSTSLGHDGKSTYIDINNDGRKEILISRDLGGLSSPAPNLYIEFFDQTCNIPIFILRNFYHRGRDGKTSIFH